VTREEVKARENNLIKV